MRFKTFIRKKCKLIFRGKILAVLVVILFLVLMYKSRYSTRDYITEEMHSLSHTLKGVTKREGTSFHLFGDQNEIDEVRSLWNKLSGIRIRYYIPDKIGDVVNREKVISNNHKIVYYQQRYSNNILDKLEIIYKNINRKGTWYVLMNHNVVVNKSAILSELDRYKWYYPVFITFTRERTTKMTFDFSTVDVCIVSSAMLEQLQKTNLQHVRELGDQWISYHISDNTSNFFCHTNQQECSIESQLSNNMVCVLPSLHLLPYAISLLVQREKGHVHQLVEEEVKQYSTALNLIPHKYLHEVRELYDREEEWECRAMGRWGVLELPHECMDLQANCFTSSLLKNSMPISLNTDSITRWRIVRAYSKFSLRSWEEYLLVMENSEGHRYLYRVVNVMEPRSDRNVVSEMKQGVLVLIQEGEDDPMGILDQYRRLLGQQEEYLTSTRYPMLFSIRLVLMITSNSTEMLTHELDEMRQEFPELVVEFWDSEEYPNFLVDSLTEASSNNVVLINHLSHLPHYDVVEKCYSHTRLNVPISLIPGQNRFKCVSVEELVRVMRQHSDIQAPLSKD